MKVRVTRTSAGDYDQPCDGATRIVANDEYGPGGWWQIEVETLDDLLEIVSRYGRIIVDKAFGTHLIDAGVMWQIEIYDKYRE